MKRPEEVTLSREEGEALITRLERDALSAEDRRMLVKVLTFYFWLLFALREAKLSLKRLKALVFGEKAKKHKPPESGGGGDGSGGQGGSGVGTAAPSVKQGKDEGGQTEAGARPAGHGRQSAEVYREVQRIECRHEELAVGERCPACGRGRLYRLPPGIEMRLDGNALLSAVRYELEKLRCSACGQVFTAALPAEAGPEKYSARARAVLALGRYYLGVPLYRLEGYQALVGVPVPDATQWDQIEHVANCAYPVFKHLERVAAQGEVIYQDDTPVRILSLIEENRHAEAQAQDAVASPSRAGMYTTGLVVQVGEQTICLYYAGRHHAGENLAALLTQREAQRDKPLVMSDALASNAADEHGLIRCHCLAHGQRKFRELEEVFPQECEVVTQALKQVFEHEEAARVQQLSAEERLAYHQAYSGPIMDELQVWLEQQRADRTVEPNSSLGKAIAYLLNPWVTLTRFLTVPGAPLDNNTAERALKLCIRQRKNSLFYATEHSAYIASLLTSLIATCVHAGVNALEYLVAVQDHRKAVFADPAAWVPWKYHTVLVPP
ncbi:MAG: IS66 family transposase [Deltaproteobacteria bacterium]|nr:IS66 family transposase [Deltaproteobacteria bacterium]